MSNWQNDISGISGNTFSSNTLTVRAAVSLLRNQGYASRVASMRVSEQYMQDASCQVGSVGPSARRAGALSHAPQPSARRTAAVSLLAGLTMGG